jgi:hypothetical protein
VVLCIAAWLEWHSVCMDWTHCCGLGWVECLFVLEGETSIHMVVLGPFVAVGRWLQGQPVPSKIAELGLQGGVTST